MGSYISHRMQLADMHSEFVGKGAHDRKKNSCVHNTASKQDVFNQLKCLWYIQLEYYLKLCLNHGCFSKINKNVSSKDQSPKYHSLVRKMQIKEQFTFIQK